MAGPVAARILHYDPALCHHALNPWQRPRCQASLKQSQHISTPTRNQPKQQHVHPQAKQNAEPASTKMHHSSCPERKVTDRQSVTHNTPLWQNCSHSTPQLRHTLPQHPLNSSQVQTNFPQQQSASWQQLQCTCKSLLDTNTIHNITLFNFQHTTADACTSYLQPTTSNIDVVPISPQAQPTIKLLLMVHIINDSCHHPR